MTLRLLRRAVAPAALAALFASLTARADGDAPRPTLGAPAVVVEDEIVPALPRPKPPPPPASDRPAESDPINEADHKSNGRIFEVVWSNAEAGFSYVNLASVNSKDLQLQNSASAGPMFGFGAGIRILGLTLGGRARLNELSTFSFWELDGELGLHIPIQKWDPYFGLHGGYAFVGSLGEELSSSASEITVHGANAGANLGVDYYFVPYLSLGLDLTGDFLFLSRPPIPLPADFKDLPKSKQEAITDQPLYKESGDSVGLGLSASLHVGVHI